MKLSAAFSLFEDVWAAVQAAFLPTLHAIWQQPSLVLRPAALSRIFMAHVWAVFGDGTDQGGREVKTTLISPNATGVVLDIGAGHGHTIDYLNRSRIAKYVALEPNALMHREIRARANAAGYSEADETLLILSCGAEDIDTINSSLGGQHHVDTIVSVLTLCTVPNPKETLSNLANEVLKPRGQLLFYEHVLSPRSDVAWWQRFWAPLWMIVFDGCRLDRPTHVWIQNVTSTDGSYGTGKIWSDESLAWGKPGEPEENLWWHQAGRFVKA